MSTEQDVSRTVYERWPLGATRQIERLESKIRETCDFMSGQVTEVLDYLEVYKPSDEVLKKRRRTKKDLERSRCS